MQANDHPFEPRDGAALQAQRTQAGASTAHRAVVAHKKIRCSSEFRLMLWKKRPINAGRPILVHVHDPVNYTNRYLGSRWALLYERWFGEVFE